MVSPLNSGLRRNDGLEKYRGIFSLVASTLLLLLCSSATYAAWRSPFLSGDPALFPEPIPIEEIARATTLRPNPSLQGIASDAAVLGRGENKGVRIELLRVIRSDELAGVRAPDGMEAVILVTRWENIHPKQSVPRAQLKSGADRSFGAGSLLSGGGKAKASDMVELDVAYQVRQPGLHAWLVTGGESHALRTESAALPAGVGPQDIFTVTRFGEKREVRLGWFVPKGSNNLALRFFDYDNGHINLPVAGTATGAVQAPAFTPLDSGTLDELDLKVISSRFSASWGETKAPSGWRYLQVDLLGKSLAKQADKGALVFADPTRYLWAQSDGGVLRYGEAPADGASTLVFTPELPHRQTVAFLVPEKTESFRLGIRGSSATLSLRATSSDAPPITPASNSISDGTALQLGLSGLHWDGQALVADLLATPAAAGKGVELDSAQQFLLKTGSSEQRPDSALSVRLYRQAPTPFVLPPGTPVRFELAFSLPPGAEPTALRFRGFDGEYSLPIDAKKIAGTRGTDAGLFAQAPPPIPAKPRQAVTVAPELVTGTASASGVALGSEPPAPAADTASTNSAPTSASSTPLTPKTNNAQPQMMPVELPVFDAASAVVETEPNDTPKQATAFTASRAATGKLAAGDGVDWFVFDVTGEPELWTLEASGPGVQRLGIQAVGGRTLVERDKRSQPNLRMDYLQLMPGRYWIVVKASTVGGEYQVRALSQGRPHHESEFEPNDDISQAQLMRFAEPRRGLIAQKDDLDLYRFSLDRPTAVTLELVPPPDQQLAMKVEGAALRVAGSKLATAGQTSTYQALLQPGDYTVTVYSERWTPGQTPYSLRLDYRDPFTLPVDIEPNDTAAQAVVLNERRSISGSVGAFGREDWYQLPTVSAPTAMTVQTTGRNSLNLRRVEKGALQYGKLIEEAAARTEQGNRYTATLEPGVISYLQIGAGGDYKVDIALQPDAATAHSQTVTTGLELVGPAKLPTFAAFHPDRQQTELVFTLKNTGGTAQQVKLEAMPGMAGWSLDAAPTELAAGQSKSVNARLSADADRTPVAALPLFVTARSGTAGSATVSLPITASCGAQAIAAQAALPLPAALFGGINVAWQALGAQQLADAATVTKQSMLFDGMTPLRQRLKIDASALPVDITMKLAGTTALPVSGITLYPAPAEGARVGVVPFSVQTSSDGTTFNEIYRGQFTPAETEQAFVFDKPVSATHVRLHLESTSGLQDGVDAVLAEFKIIAAPGTEVFSGKPLNLADPALGGHVVWVSWPKQDYVELQALLTEANEGRSSDIERLQPIDWVIGFHHQRAARIARLEWRDQSTANTSNRRPEQVAVAASIEGPNGPWQPLGLWTLTRSAEGVASLDLPNAPWARYLRFSVPGADTRTRWQLAETLRVFEHAQDKDYRSILGEWGHYASHAYYEQQLRVSAPAQAQAAAGTTAAQAKALDSGKTVPGRASAGQREEWYRVQIPAGLERVEFRFGGEGRSRLLPELQSSDGAAVTLTEADDDAGVRVFHAQVQAGAEYRLKVAEANRSIMIVWDNSASVRAYHDGMYQAIARFADEIQPGLEVVNLMPLRDGNAQPLLREWTSNPVEVKAAIGGYNRLDDSSDAERTLISATEMLGRRPGNRAILLLTDAESPGDREAARLWQRFREVRPRLFTLELQLTADTAKVAHYQDLMQNWAQVNHGDYRVFRSQADLDRAFERTACLLRSPAEYNVTWQPAPGKGELWVVWESGKAMAGASLELILDASGSMKSNKNKLAGKLKMEVARGVMQDIIKALPDDTQVGLRFYGHRVREGNKGDCEDSELVAPIKTLDRTKLSDAVSKVQALGSTPIAYSIARACDDLSKIDGQKSLVVITDGKEECKGDPAAAVAACRAQGMDVRVDVVGFALADAADKVDMLRVAEQGKGRFFDAQDATALSAAILESLAMPIEVLDSRDQTIAKGLTGQQGQSLYQGNYTVVIHTAKGDVTVRDVAVREKQTTTITLSREGDGIRTARSLATSLDALH